MFDKSDSQRFDLARLSAHRLLAHVDYRTSLPSTNDRALRLAAEGNVPTPALALAGRQTAGRGRGANRWWSADGALTFSLLISRRWIGIDAVRLPQVSLTTAVAVTDALGQFAPNVPWRIKWPNDVLAGRRKVCGVLIETHNSVAAGDQLVVIGVGLNVNNSSHDAPEELRDSMTSLRDQTRVGTSLTDVLDTLLTSLQLRLRQLADRDRRLVDDWRSRCALSGQAIEFETGGHAIGGVCRGIDAEGRLTIEQSGRLHRISSGIVKSFGD